MNAATLDTYMNLLLFVAIFGGAAYGIYRWSKPTPKLKEAIRRAEGHRPRVKQEETDGYPEEWESSRPPITDWKEVPTVSPMHKAIATPPSLRQKLPPKPPVMHKFSDSRPMRTRTTAPHSPYRRDDVDVTIPATIASSESSDSPRCDTPTYSGGDSGGSGDGGSCSTD